MDGGEVNPEPEPDATFVALCEVSSRHRHQKAPKFIGDE